MKRVELIFEFSSDGKITVFPKGTQGAECLSLMEFLDKIDGIDVVETVKTEDFFVEKNKNEETVKDIT